MGAKDGSGRPGGRGMTNSEHEIAKKAYDWGFEDGLRAFAHWTDGEQYVGTCGTSLMRALEERKEGWSYHPPTPDDIAAWKDGKEREPF